MSTASSVLIVIFVFIIVKHLMDTRARHESERLRLIEEALRAGNLDDQSRVELMATLTGRRAAPRYVSADGVGVLTRLIAFVGWLAFCVGISFFILCLNSHRYEYLAVPATIIGCVGFGLVTYPFVIRELNTPKRHPVTSAGHAQQRS